MRVILNGVSAVKPKTGVGHTTANLHAALLELGTDDRFWLYPGEAIGRAMRRVVGKPQPPGRGPSIRASGRSGQDSRPRSSRFPWRKHLVEFAKAAYRVHFQTVARWGGFDLYHEPNFVPVRTHLPTVVTVHDLSVLLFPEWHPADRVAFHERHFRRGVETADHVIVVSESVRQEVLDLLSLPPHRVTAIHNGIGGQFQPQSPETVERVRQKFGLPARYTLVVGTIEPRKNVRMLIRAFCDLPPAIRNACPLVLAGGWGWKSEPERELFEEEARDKGAMHLGYVPDADLPALYAGAAAQLYPSFYEGFGLPPIEMLACGGTVIASTAAAVKEVVGRHALLLDPHDLVAWREAMRRVAAEPSSFDADRESGMTHAGRFTWNRAAQKTLSVYRKVLQGGGAVSVENATRSAA